VVRNSVSVIGLKVTPTALIGVITDFTAGILTVKHQELDDTQPGSVIERLAELAKELRSGLAGPPIGIGVAVSGDVDARHGVVRHSPLMGWRDVAVADLMAKRVKVPVVVTNDVRALTVAEHWFGVGVDSDSFAVVTIGSGIGCGLYINGEVVSGASGVSGELGHLPLAPGKLICTCGRRGCVETVASSDAILTRTRETTGRRDLDLAGAVKLAHEGDRHAREAFDRAGEVIGSALAAMVNLVGPELVVIAGEGVAEYDLYEERMRQAFADHAFGAAGDCRLMLRSHTFDDWARGAAATVIRSYVRGEPPLQR
jgi:predicted NBD/HSP70 family sugar kinase